MAAIENILAWARQERQRLARDLEQLQSGRLRIVEKLAQPPGWLEIDTTAQSIELCRQYLSELGAIIALHPSIVPTTPAAPPLTPRYVPPVPQTQAPDHLLPSDVHPDWVVGWGVVKGPPPNWEFAGIFATQTEADEAAAKAGDGYYARWGSYHKGRNEFASGPQFDRVETL